MDHTAIIRFVEDRFLGGSAYLTNRDKVQPNLLEFFDFTNIPWATPPKPPAAASASSPGFNPCHAGTMEALLDLQDSFRAKRMGSSAG